MCFCVCADQTIVMVEQKKNAPFYRNLKANNKIMLVFVSHFLNYGGVLFTNVFMALDNRATEFRGKIVINNFPLLISLAIYVFCGVSFFLFEVEFMIISGNSV